MEVDAVTVVLLITLGAAIANAFDAAFHFSPKITAWIQKFFNPQE